MFSSSWSNDLTELNHDLLFPPYPPSFDSFSSIDHHQASSCSNSNSNSDLNTFSTPNFYSNHNYYYPSNHSSYNNNTSTNNSPSLPFLSIPSSTPSSSSDHLLPQFSTASNLHSFFNITPPPPPIHLPILPSQSSLYLNPPHLPCTASSSKLNHSSSLLTPRQFFCPKCGKPHSRQSNLHAHLRDTHSDLKKVLCDIPGCHKAYKRVSECRRHKKDMHGIPLPSELAGKSKRTRKILSSSSPLLKFHS